MTKRSRGHLPPTHAAPLAPGLRPRQWLVLALLAAATFAAFAGVLKNGWILVDDPAYVYRNPRVCRGLTLDGMAWFLREPHGNNWEPLTAWSHMLDVQLFGLAPTGHHATSLLLHALNAFLVAIVLHRLTGAWWRSVLVAGLFALHPLRVESVAWIAERKDVLSGLFFWLAVDAYRRWTLRPGRVRYAWLVGAFALGLMSKPMLVTFPFVLVLLDVWPLHRLASAGRPARPRGQPRGVAAPAGAALPAPPRSLAGLFLEKSPLFAMAAVSAMLAFGVQRGTGALAPPEAFPFGQRVCNAAISYWRYALKTVWPTGLAAIYPYPRGPQTVGAIAAAAGLVIVTFLALREVRRRPYLAVGWLWYLGMLVPVIGLVQTGSQAYADRFTYLPTIGLLVAAVWGLAEIVPDSRRRRVAVFGMCVLILTASGVVTARQVARWKDTSTLFTYTLAVTRDNPDAHRHLGHALYESGQRRLAILHLEASLDLPPGYEDSVRRVLSAEPSDVDTRRRLAAALVLEGRVEDAIVQYREILRRNPDDLDALNNVAWIRATHADARCRDGAEAVRLAEHARDVSPEPQAVLYSTLAAAYAESGRFPEAVKAGERAVELARGSEDGREAAGYAWQLRGYRAGRPFHFED